jgi:hypothetical protein
VDYKDRFDYDVLPVVLPVVGIHSDNPTDHYIQTSDGYNPFVGLFLSANEPEVVAAQPEVDNSHRKDVVQDDDSKDLNPVE